MFFEVVRILVATFALVLSFYAAGYVALGHWPLTHAKDVTLVAFLTVTAYSLWRDRRAGHKKQTPHLPSP
ncbi:MAG: hypothetical protein K2X62_00800 [Beijerinckiaceae bacterium]|jgi:4-amino-4-deoxy-L-arabinose transferase-like glycosyltransferase|nr:hypothetical protein [Beijerinckiaceae bacterium]MDO9441993.1 hypothetical protein [Beijerinckiaceae bacterium]